MERNVCLGGYTLFLYECFYSYSHVEVENKQILKLSVINVNLVSKLNLIHKSNSVLLCI